MEQRVLVGPVVSLSGTLLSGWASFLFGKMRIRSVSIAGDTEEVTGTVTGLSGVSDSGCTACWLEGRRSGTEAQGSLTQGSHMWEEDQGFRPWAETH